MFFTRLVNFNSYLPNSFLLINWHKLAMKIKLQKSIKEKELDQYYQNQYAALADQHCRTFNISGNNSSGLKSSNSVSYNSSSSRVSHLDSMTMSRNLRKMSTIGNKSIFSDFNKKHRSYTIHSHQNRSLQSSKNPSRNLFKICISSVESCCFPKG